MSNIFSCYKVPELNLTKAFINTLEHTDINLSQKYLNEYNFKSKFKKTHFKNIRYEQEVSFQSIAERLNLKEKNIGSGRVDGVLRSENLVIYIESKYGTRFREKQLNNYQKILSKEKAEWRILLLISDSKKDLENVKFRVYKNIDVFTDDWNHISEFCESIKEKLENKDLQKYSKDIFLLDQLSEYLSEMGVVSFKGFTKPQIYTLENRDLSKPQYLDDKLKDQITKLFGGTKKNLIELGFDEEGFTW
ncbi:MAG: PD-(D/E)XK nuclease family protein [Candidatus Hydrothermarchaeales archaeon]